MSKKILILGAGGMAGHTIATYLSEEGYEISTVSANNKLNDRTALIDATNIESLKKYLDQNTFDIVVNCIGILIKESESRKDTSTFLNSYLPHFLEQYYKNNHSTRIIHLSTDCVFSGKHGPYKENDFQDGESFYDKSKAVGEIVNDKDLTFRQSIIGPDMNSGGEGLFNWFMYQEGEIKGFTKAIWNGITTLELAKGIDGAIRQNLSGVYHLVPSENITKYELLMLFNKVFDRGLVIAPEHKSMDSNKTLLNTRKDFSYQASDYSTMITELEQWMNSHKDLYPHYFKSRVK